MKKIKNALVSVLLFSFVFLVMHDFVIVKLDGCNHYDTSSTQSHLLISSTNNLEIVDDIHEIIHSIMAIDLDSTPYLPSFIASMKPSQTIYGISSHNNFVLERPPLS